MYQIMTSRWKWLIPLVILFTAMAGGCGSSRQAVEGDIVAVHYTGTLDDGNQFDSSEGRNPLEFTLGAGQMIPGFEQAVLGMKVGETKTVTIPAAEAYGERDESLLIKIPIEQLPPEGQPAVGMALIMTGADGRQQQVTIVEVTETTVTVDANHFLAGKDLTFEITLVEIR
jgi:peptidylprolyl isomerase